MPFSFHSHSGQFCEHAKGTLEEVVQEAIKKNFIMYGLSEHCPRYREQDLYPEEFHLKPSDLIDTFTAYVHEARRLQQKYQSQITLIVGLESETINSSSSTEALCLKSEHNLDYILGSVHHVHETPIDFDEEQFAIALKKSSNDEEKLFEAYFDAQYKTLKEVKPLIVGHFDVIRIYRPNWQLTQTVWEKIQRNIDYAIDYGGLFEINTAGWKVGLPDAYPQRDILQLIISKGGRCTISDDSHGPSTVGRDYDKLYKYLKEMEIYTLYYLDYGDDGKSMVVKELKDALEHKFWDQWT
ncbi:2339_t:CDS:2 [Paraglomus occultum]|uniref:Histidinol-phosphatase n=1 Tax=Paraglomus occultum TaxID=144539 RepID=A0A9N9A091_9GLOM|nr:2339_t:CDS:2 [Paraglomus occultum]